MLLLKINFETLIEGEPIFYLRIDSFVIRVWSFRLKQTNEQDLSSGEQNRTDSRVHSKQGHDTTQLCFPLIFLKRAV